MSESMINIIPDPYEKLQFSLEFSCFSIRLTSDHENVIKKRVEFIYILAWCGFSMLEAKNLVEQLANTGGVEISSSSPEAIRTLLSNLKSYGMSGVSINGVSYSKPF